jgi:SAM-dependent methyltransferase
MSYESFKPADLVSNGHMFCEYSNRGGNEIAYLLGANDLNDLLENKEVPFLPGQKLLDVGSGGGSFLDEICKLRPDLMGIKLDKSYTDSDKASELGNRENLLHVASDAIKLPFADDTFEHIFSCWCLPYLSDIDRQTALLEMYRCLKPGGQMTVLPWVEVECNNCTLAPRLQKDATHSEEFIRTWSEAISGAMPKNENHSVYEEALKIVTERVSHGRIVDFLADGADESGRFSGNVYEDGWIDKRYSTVRTAEEILKRNTRAYGQAKGYLFLDHEGEKVLAITYSGGRNDYTIYHRVYDDGHINTEPDYDYSMEQENSAM